MNHILKDMGGMGFLKKGNHGWWKRSFHSLIPSSAFVLLWIDHIHFEPLGKWITHVYPTIQAVVFRD